VFVQRDTELTKSHWLKLTRDQLTNELTAPGATGPMSVNQLNCQQITK